MFRFTQLLLALLFAVAVVTACESKPAAKESQPPAKPKCATALALTADEDELEEEDEEDDVADAPAEDKEKVPAKPTYDKDIKPLLKNHCTSCHSSKGTKQAPLLDTFKLVKKKQSLVASQISSGDMPPEDSEPMTKAEKDLVAAWKKAGYLENDKDSADEEDEDDTESKPKKKINGDKSDDDDCVAESTSSATIADDKDSAEKDEDADDQGDKAKAKSTKE